ncbi:hypothetical protein ACFVIM_33865, partial [Streptomyces sp. NPDC057638]
PVHGPRPRGRPRAVDGIQRFWRLDRDRLTADLPEPLRSSVDSHRDAVRQAARHWRSGFFAAGDTDRLGPRRAAAYCVIFHWNRGRFTAALQKLLTEALVSEGVGPAGPQARSASSGEPGHPPPLPPPPGGAPSARPDQPVVR